MMTDGVSVTRRRERPARVIRSGLADNIRQDEAFRALIRDFLGAAEAPADASRSAESS